MNNTLKRLWRLGLLVACPAVLAGQARPNIILIMTDDQGWGETSYYNHPVLQTPNLDAMAANGLRFDRFYAASPVCSPTRASVLTGRSPFRTGVVAHGWPLRHQERTLAQALSSIGYATAHFGKWHLNGLRGPGAPIFEEDSHSPGAFGFQYWLSTSNYFDRDPLLSRNGEFEQFSGDSSTIIVEEALKFIEKCNATGQPFFSVIWDGSPHSPFVASESDRSHFSGLNESSQNHYGELVAFDRSLGLLRSRLHQMGIAANTLLWYCSDNGGLPRVEPDTVGGLRDHKGTVWEGGIRVPAILEWPGVIEQGATEYPASTMDIFPTLAQILDLPDTGFIQPVDGRSLQPLFQSRPQRRDDPIGILFENTGAFIDNNFKLVMTDARERTFALYDLATDPRETTNIAELEAGRFKDLKERFDTWYRSVKTSGAGEDYAAGKVLPGDPAPHFWKDDPRYESYLPAWSSRPEYKAFLSNAVAESTRPNVILIMTDDQGYGDFGFTGNPVIKTPHLDALAGKSAVMNQFYVSPVCAPTRASLMTGRYNFRTRAIDTWNGHARMDPTETTIAEILREAGYATGLFGKWHLGDNYPMRPQDQGFEEVLMHRGGGIGQPSDPDGAEDAYTDPVLFHNGEAKRMPGYCTDIFFDQAMSWMREMQQNQRPFFTYIATNAPHGPFGDVPGELYQAYKSMDLRNSAFPQIQGHPLSNKEDLDRRARIYAMITNIDDNVGRLVEFVEQQGLGGNTLIIFLADNGPIGNRYVAGFNGSKTEVREGGIRSPLLLNWPGRLSAGATSEHIAAHIDIAPTILEACGFPPAKAAGMDGRSLWPLLQGDNPDWPDRFIVIQAHRGDEPVLYHNFAIRNQHWKLMNPSGFSNRDFDGPPAFELYDMEKDPFEMVNLAEAHPLVLQQLRSAYVEWFADVGNTRPDNYDAPRIWIDPAVENPVVLTRQDGEHFKGAPFGRESIGKWKLRIIKPGSYSVRFRFFPVEMAGTSLLKLNGRGISKPVSKGDSEVVFDVVMEMGDVDLLPILSFGTLQYSPWKVDISM